MSSGIELKTIKALDGADSSYGSSSALQGPGYVTPVGVDNVALDIGDEKTRKPVSQNSGNGANSGAEPTTEVVEIRGLLLVQTTVRNTYHKYNRPFWSCIYALLIVAYFVYFGLAMAHDKFGDEGSIRLLVCTIVAAIGLVIHLIPMRYTERIKMPHIGPADPEKNAKMRKIAYICLVVAVVLFIIIYLIVDVAVNTPTNLISLTGMAFFILSFFIFSRNPAKIKWRPVFWGLVLQFFFALIILRWRFGYRAFEYLGKRVQEFLSYSDKGAMFVFGEKYTDHFFAFKVSNMKDFFIIFLFQNGTIVSFLNYLFIYVFV